MLWGVTGAVFAVSVGLCTRWQLAAGFVALCAAALGVPALLERHVGGDLTDVSEVWARPAVFVAVGGAGLGGGVYMAVLHPETLETSSIWLLCVVAACVGAGIRLGSSFYLQPLRSPSETSLVAARRLVSILLQVTAWSLAAWTASVVAGTELAPLILRLGIVWYGPAVSLVGFAAVAVWAVALLVPRPLRSA